MSVTLSYKSKQFLWLVLKLIIVIACCYFIYNKIVYNDTIHFSDFYTILIDSEIFSIRNTLFLIAFSLMNWFFEILKWQLLIKKIKTISWFEAAKQSLASLTFSLFTPNRIGEYGAKAFHFKKEQRKEVLILNFIGNFYQLIVTVLIGVFGVLYLYKHFSRIIPLREVIIVSSGILIFFLMALLLLKKVVWIQNWFQKIISRVDFVSFKDNQKVLYFSVLRYLLFSHQFYFLLLLFNTDISYINAMTSISSMYLLASIVPMLSLFDFVLKGSIAVFVFDFFQINPMVILSITTIMWLFNFAFPALIGSYYVLRFKPIGSS